MTWRERWVALAARFPSTTAAALFGTVAALVAYFSWVPSARLGHRILLLSLGVGAAHAIAGGVLGRPLIRRTNRLSAPSAAKRGALISAVAIGLFSPALSLWIASPPARVDGGLLGLVRLTALVTFFGILAGGWAVVVTCAALGWFLNVISR